MRLFLVLTALFVCAASPLGSNKPLTFSSVESGRAKPYRFFENEKLELPLSPLSSGGEVLCWPNSIVIGPGLRPQGGEFQMWNDPVGSPQLTFKTDNGFAETECDDFPRPVVEQVNGHDFIKVTGHFFPVYAGRPNFVRYSFRGEYKANYTGLDRTATFRVHYDRGPYGDFISTDRFTQVAGCVYNITSIGGAPGRLVKFPPHGGTFTLQVIKSPTCANLQLVSNRSWLTISGTTITVEPQAQGEPTRYALIRFGTGVVAVRQRGWIRGEPEPDISIKGLIQQFTKCKAEECTGGDESPSTVHGVRG